MIVCHCERVGDAAVGTAIAAGAGTVAEVTACTRAGGGCGSCWRTIEGLLAAADRRTAAVSTAA